MVWLIVGVVLVLILGLSAFIVVKMSKTLACPTVRTYEFSHTESRRKNLIDWNVLNSIKQEPFSMKSSRGYTLNGKIYYQEKPQKRTKVLIFVHGWTSHYVEMMTYYEAYYKRGFNIVGYDQRYHGDSEGPFCTMGYHEHEDLVEVCAKVREIFGKDCVLGIMGESMGAATVMLASPKIEGLAFAIEDSGYSTLVEETNFLGGYQYHLPKWPIMALIRLYTKKRYHYDIDDVRPIDSVKQCENIPMLFIHGDSDTMVPSKMLMPIVEAKKGFKMYSYFKDSIHCESLLNHKQEYDALVGKFLESIGYLD